MSIAAEPEGYRQKYDKPPIVEAVLEVRFDGPISDKQIEKIKAALRKDYPASTNIDLIEVVIDGAQSRENRKSGRPVAKVAWAWGGGKAGAALELQKPVTRLTMPATIANLAA